MWVIFVKRMPSEYPVQYHFLKKLKKGFYFIGKKCKKKKFKKKWKKKSGKTKHCMATISWWPVSKDPREASCRQSPPTNGCQVIWKEKQGEGLLVAAHDHAINSRNYQKIICGQQVENKCRMCSQHEETVSHIVSGCEVLVHLQAQ